MLQVVVEPGQAAVQNTISEVAYEPFHLDNDPMSRRLRLISREIVSGSGRGTRLLVHETMNAADGQDSMWLDRGKGYRPYHQKPSFLDAENLFHGPDPFYLAPNPWSSRTWTLLGKVEMYVPYNSHALLTTRTANRFGRGGSLRPDLLRYELHRVWVVAGESQIDQSGMMLFIDEDSWQILCCDHYDKDLLVGFSESHCANFWRIPAFRSIVDTSDDLRSGAYRIYGLPADTVACEFGLAVRAADFEPQFARTGKNPMRH